MASVELKCVSKVFRIKKGEEVYAVTNLSLRVADHELVVVVGPSGCGKTTTLRLIAGLDKVTAGTILFENILMNEVRPQNRDVAMVFQNHALYPHLTVFENMAFGLELRRVQKAEIETRVKKVAATLGLSAFLDRYPAVLSGGQRQRAAIGRAIAREPKVFLFDEPLANLDAPLRAQMRTEFARLHQRLGATMIYVTHDQSEAMTLGRRIVVLKEGVVQQVADPGTLYHQPANIFVAGFIGSPPMNLFRGRITDRDGAFIFQENNPGGAATGLRMEIPLPQERAERLRHFAEGNIVLGLRPEHLSVAESPATNAISATLETLECLGTDTRLHCSTGAHAFVARVRPDVCGTPGERVPLHFEMPKAIFFNPASGCPIV